MPASTFVWLCRLNRLFDNKVVKKALELLNAMQAEALPKWEQFQQKFLEEAHEKGQGRDAQADSIALARS